jgi:hypothetical protein
MAVYIPSRYAIHNMFVRDLRLEQVALVDVFGASIASALCWLISLTNHTYTRPSSARAMHPSFAFCRPYLWHFWDRLRRAIADRYHVNGSRHPRPVRR